MLLIDEKIKPRQDGQQVDVSFYEMSRMNMTERRIFSLFSFYGLSQCSQQCFSQGTSHKKDILGKDNKDNEVEDDDGGDNEDKGDKDDKDDIPKKITQQPTFGGHCKQGGQG